jgi:DNA-binding transcriptional LysR family regulator
MEAMSLRCFYEATQAGSMRAAAEKMGLAVSSVSRQISQLESEIGLLLIERGRRTIKPTEAGQLVIDYHRRTSAERELFDVQVQALRGAQTGRVDIAIGEGFITTALADRLNNFLSNHPGVMVSAVAASSVEVMRMVAEDEVHAGFVFHAPPDPKIRTKLSISQPIELLVHPRHPLAALEQVRLSDIASHRLCLPPDSFRIRQIIAEAEAEEGIWLKPAFVTSSVLLLKEMVKSGDFVTLIPRMGAALEIEAGLLRRVRVVCPPLEKTSANIVVRLGRQLTEAPLRLLNSIETHLREKLALPPSA